MNESETNIAQQIALVASRLQAQRTGHAPKAVTVVLSADTLVITLHEALTPAEKALSKSICRCGSSARLSSAVVWKFHRRNAARN